MNVILVRHAMPAVRADVPPEVWSLSEEGRAAARRLATLLPADAVLVASDEPKAAQTLPSAVVDARFREVRRQEAFADDFAVARRSYVEGQVPPDWEPHACVVSRFSAGVSWFAVPGRPLVIATHGMAMTVWLSSVIGLADPGSFWAVLRFPDAIAVDVSGRRWWRLHLGLG
jgi:broad specificity phosphatase PhoE